MTPMPSMGRLYIYLHFCLMIVVFMVYVGKYTCPMNGMGDDFQQESPFPTDSQISQIH